MIQNTRQAESATATIIATAALIAGNLIGAGILGLPIHTGLAGLLPSIAAVLASSAMMDWTDFQTLAYFTELINILDS